MEEMRTVACLPALTRPPGEGRFILGGESV
jgi:hypothetical protein